MKDKRAGLRTFPLVSISSCAFMLVGIDIYHGSDPEGRIMYAIITDICFIGGGAIFKSNDGVQGNATAVVLQKTAAIGISVAYGRYEIAIILSVISFLILQFSELFKAKR